MEEKVAVEDVVAVEVTDVVADDPDAFADDADADDVIADADDVIAEDDADNADEAVIDDAEAALPRPTSLSTVSILEEALSSAAAVQAAKR